LNPPGINRPYDILVIDDDVGDIRLVAEALKVAQVRHNLSVVRDGDEAMAFLHREAQYAYAPRPDLILLDLNLPKKYGRKVLAEIKGDPDLRRIPVVVLTTSDSELNVTSSYDLHANAYVVKPVDLKQFMQIIKVTMEFWLTVVKLPPR
jgi:chemotaxis family two-component system response regulator Rcp1